MSQSSTRRRMKTERRARCKAALSEFLAENPGVVSQGVALRFLTHGHRKSDLPKMIMAERVAAAAIHIPEHIKEQARGMFRGIQAARKKMATVRASLALKKRQRVARKISRRVAA